MGPLVPRLRYLLDDLGQLHPRALRARGCGRSPLSRSGALADLSGLLDEVMTAGDGRQALASLFSHLSIISRPEQDLVAEALR
ncbi:MAG: hypothetical protein VYE22_25355 [Myxococcota bacterium]|nr:hypothetical protein [Myxococcota bacterium]